MSLFTAIASAMISILSTLMLLSCKPVERSSLVLYTKEVNANIRISSSCRTSSVPDLQNEQSIKEAIAKSTNESFKKLKLKEGASPERSNYRISKTELVVTERCGGTAVGGKPFVGLQHVLILENITTGQSIEFISDTAVIEQQSLTKPSTLVPSKIVLEAFIPGLTEKNYSKVKAHFKK